MIRIATDNVVGKHVHAVVELVRWNNVWQIYVFFLRGYHNALLKNIECHAYCCLPILPMQRTRHYVIIQRHRIFRWLVLDRLLVGRGHIFPRCTAPESTVKFSAAPHKDRIHLPQAILPINERIHVVSVAWLRCRVQQRILFGHVEACSFIPMSPMGKHS